MTEFSKIQLPASLEARIAKSVEGLKTPCPKFKRATIRLVRLTVNAAGDIVEDGEPVEAKVIDLGPNWTSWLINDCLPWAFAEADKIIEERAL